MNKWMLGSSIQRFHVSSKSLRCCQTPVDRSQSFCLWRMGILFMYLFLMHCANALFQHRCHEYEQSQQNQYLKQTPFIHRIRTTTRCQTMLMLREDKLFYYTLNFVSACSARIFSHTYVTVRPGWVQSPLCRVLHKTEREESTSHRSYIFSEGFVAFLE